MHTFADLAKALNRSTVYLSGLQSRFELPTFDGAGYSEAYLAFLQTVVHLRTLSITEETLRDLWHIEKKLLVLLHADSTGSPTWFLDSCGATTSPKRRLLLTNYELGAEVYGMRQQSGPHTPCAVLRNLPPLRIKPPFSFPIPDGIAAGSQG
jgi:hypothetical protein